MRALATAYLWDEHLLAAANARGENYWFAWVQDLFEALGAPALALSPDVLTQPQALECISTLVLPDLRPDYLTAGQRRVLHRWVEQGGLLIGLATEGLDELFGVRSEGRVAQEEPWEITATVRLTDRGLARPLYYPHQLDRDLPIVSPLLLLALVAARELAVLGDAQGRALGHPAVTLHQVGEGWSCLWAFDLAHTVWALQQGRPIDRDWVPDGYLRSSDGMLTVGRDVSYPSTDLLVYLLRNVVALTAQPLVDALPAVEGAPADALFYWGGDDEAAAGTQLPAADFMASRGLPYHINIMPREGRFALSPHEFARLRELGTEPSLHLNFVDGHPHPLHFTHEHVAQQVRLYREAFAETPVCTVFHWTLWCGWTEPAQWLRQQGVLADNSRFGSNRFVLNPTNECAYAYGTALPFFFRLGPHQGNQRLDFVSEPITAYECGYDRERDELALEPLHRAIDHAAYWHSTCNMFYHPVCLHGFAAARAAIDEALSYIRRRGIRAVHMGNDRLNFWWRARSAARVTEAVREETSVSCLAVCDWTEGWVLRVPVPGEPAVGLVDGCRAPCQVREEYGRCWALVSLPGGPHRVQLRW